MIGPNCIADSRINKYAVTQFGYLQLGNCIFGYLQIRLLTNSVTDNSVTDNSVTYNSVTDQLGYSLKKTLKTSCKECSQLIPGFLLGATLVNFFHPLYKCMRHIGIHRNFMAYTGIR